jgi:hypothetical protein
MRMALEAPWQVSIAELNGYLRLAGVGLMSQDGVVSACDLDLSTRVALVEALHRSVRCARESAPPVDKWLAASESLVLNDDGSEAAQQKADAFWLCLTHVVSGCQALVMLGDLSELPFFIELLKHQPAGHLTEMAADVLCHTVDPSHELDTPHLIRRAEDWWNSH